MPEYIMFMVGGSRIFMYVTRFTRFFRENGDEVYALELKEGDILMGKEKVVVKQRSKICQQVQMYKPLLSEDIPFFVEGIMVKRS